MNLQMLIKYLKKLLIISFLLFSLILVFFNRLKIKTAIELPFDAFSFKLYSYWIIALFMLLFSILLIIIYYTNISIKSTLNLLENFKQNFDFIIVYIYMNYINFNEIYRYFSYHKQRLFILYVITTWFIRIIVVFFFLLDVFYFKILLKFFMVLPLLLVPLIFHVFYYGIKRHFNIECTQITDKVQAFIYYPELQVSGVIPLKDYIHETSLKLLKKSQKLSRGTLLLDPDFVYSWEITHGLKLNRQETLANYKKKVELLTLHYNLIYTFETFKSIYDLYCNIIIRLLYFIGWCYIFYISNSSEFILIFNKLFNIYLYVEEPFSGITLGNNNDNDIS